MKQDQVSGPWWKYGYVWLIIAGPAVVVAAALATTWIAARSPDPVLAQEHDRRAAQGRQNASESRALLPALQGRNHVATPLPAR